MESAQAHIVSAGLVVHDTEHIRVTVVFDGKGDRITSEPASKDSDCLIVFAPAAMTADDLIEQLVGASEKPVGIVVATGDRLERETVTSLGAEVISPANFEAWVERCRSVQSRRVRARSSRDEWNNRLPL
jgi:predicted RNA-binding protein with PIN domain